MKAFLKSLSFALLLVCAGCGSAPAASPSLTAAAPTADPDMGYQLGPGDKLRITTYGEADLTGEFVVGDRGAVSFPLVGEIPAAILLSSLSTTT